MKQILRKHLTILSPYSNADPLVSGVLFRLISWAIRYTGKQNNLQRGRGGVPRPLLCLGGIVALPGTAVVLIIPVPGV